MDTTALDAVLARQFYTDKVRLVMDKRLGNSVMAELKRRIPPDKQGRRITFRQKRNPASVERPWFFVELFRFTPDEIRLVRENIWMQRDCRITTVESALDLLVATKAEAAEIQQYLHRHLVQRWWRDEEVFEDDEGERRRRPSRIREVSSADEPGGFPATRYLRDKGAGRGLTIYSERDSKVAGGSCCHCELRISSAKALAAVGIRDPLDLIDFDHWALWQRSVRLFDLPSYGELGRTLRGRRRMRRADPKEDARDAAAGRVFARWATYRHGIHVRKDDRKKTRDRKKTQKPSLSHLNMEPTAQVLSVALRSWCRKYGKKRPPRNLFREADIGALIGATFDPVGKWSMGREAAATALTPQHGGDNTNTNSSSSGSSRHNKPKGDSKCPKSHSQ